MARNYNFASSVDDFVRETQGRMTAFVRETIKRTVDIAQTPTAKGGKMRVDTGFLRASGQLSLSGLPTGPVRGDPDQKYQLNDNTVTITLANYKLGDTLYFGWTANYAIYREAYDGFLESAIQMFPQTAAKVTAEIKQRVAK